VLSEGAQMRKLMGLSGFDSTKGKKVPGTDLSATDVRRKPRKYMQVFAADLGYEQDKEA
jgi:U4/U6.U5 tri-snRNP-associated protein 3